MKLLSWLVVGAALATPLSGSAGENPTVALETTNGVIVIELFEQQAPITVNNFLEYVDAGFYDGLIFPRVEAGFVIQTGGYDAQLNRREPGEEIPLETRSGLRNLRAMVAMARLDDPNSASAQFFINMRNNAHLDRGPDRPGYAVFGRVVAGMDVAQTIELSETGIKNGMAAVPLKPVVIEKAYRRKPG
jgi:peptidyl-prolyl cis-trans isomerase A (cyclophilin A)